MKTLVTAAIAALTLGLAASADAGIEGCDGTSFNGIAANAISYQGVSLQGMTLQGVNMQGVTLQGARNHGAEVTIGSAVLVRIELPR